MKNLYVKNYKSFSEQLFELKDVNFFVGENSTGKTSILKLINILSSQEFWIATEFNNNEVELGFFDEIVNKNTNENSFSVAIEYPTTKTKPSKFILIEFKEQDNIPNVTRIKTSINEKDVLIRFVNKQIQFQTKKKSHTVFLNWARDLSFTEPIQTIEIPSNRMPFSIILRIVEDTIDNIDSTENNTFHIIDFPFHKSHLWIAPIRAKAKRIYESYKIKYSPEGDHIPFLLRKLIGKSGTKNKEIIKILEAFGRESNLFDKIGIKELGKDSSSPFEINVYYNSIPIRLTNVGYGVSQSLPIVIEILASKEQMITIQQPEVHLHPKAQAALGSLIFNSFMKDKNQFIIETHSDYMINRFKHDLSKNRNKKPSAQILFFERDKKGSKCTSLPLDETGNFSIKPPSKYRKFFIDEELKSLSL